MLQNELFTHQHDMIHIRHVLYKSFTYLLTYLLTHKFRATSGLTVHCTSLYDAAFCISDTQMSFWLSHYVSVHVIWSPDVRLASRRYSTVVCLSVRLPVLLPASTVTVHAQLLLQQASQFLLLTTSSLVGHFVVTSLCVTADVIMSHNGRVVYGKPTDKSACGMKSVTT